MTLLRMATFAATAAALMAPALPVTAEELTAEQILDRMKAQRTRTLGFVEQSKPAGEETEVSVAPSAPSVDTSTGLAQSPSDGGSSGVTLATGNDATSGSTTAPSIQTQTAGTAPSTGTTTITGLQPVDDGAATGLAASGDAGVAKSNVATVAASGGSESMPSVSTATAEPLKIDLTIYFDFDSAVLKAASKTQLDALCQAVKLDTGNGTYQIIGHTDAKGKASYNKRLSQARAEEVVRYMVGTCGISASRLSAVGAGEEQLKLPEDPGSGENRRVEVQVLS